jgi:hypothetical protein
MLQLYILVLQCLRVLDASPGVLRLACFWLRAVMCRLGLQHLLAPSIPTSSGTSGHAVGDVMMGWLPAGVNGAVASTQTPHPALPSPSAAMPQPSMPVQVPFVLLVTPVQILAVGAVLAASAWLLIAMVLALPLIVGRLLVSHCFAHAVASRLSDFLPLSLGVVVLSAMTLAFVKIAEAFPAICHRAAAVQNRRCFHFILCTMSFITIFLVTIFLIPVGLGTLLLRLMLPLKAQSVYQVPVVSLVMDCWCLGLVVGQVFWRLAHSDVLLHSFHAELSGAWAEVDGSLTNFFFDLGAHLRAWRRFILPLLEALTWHLLLPRTVANTLLQYLIPVEQDFLRAALLMFSYHVMLAGRLW